MAHADTNGQLVEPPAKVWAPSPQFSPVVRWSDWVFAEFGCSMMSASERILASVELLPVPSGHSLPVGDGRGERSVALLRATKSEGVLASRLRTALEWLNSSRKGHPAPPSEAITPTVDELTRDHSAMSLEAPQAEFDVFFGVQQTGGALQTA